MGGNRFLLRLQDAVHGEEIAGVASFVGADASGSFGILAGHARMMTRLQIGLARYRLEDGDWHFLAQAGGILYFRAGILTLSAERYLLGDDYRDVSRSLQTLLLQEEESLHKVKESLHRMEEEVFRRLWRSNLKNR